MLHTTPTIWQPGSIMRREPKPRTNLSVSSDANEAATNKEGRDFYNAAPKPEYYKPYVYPHPLQRGL